MLLSAEILKIIKSKKFFITLIFTICFNLLYCWFVHDNLTNRSIEYSKQYISDTEKQIKELKKKLKKENDAKIKRIYQEQIDELSTIVQEEKIKLQYTSNPKKKMEEEAQYYKTMYKNYEKYGSYKQLELYKLQYRILSENIKMRKYYKLGDKLDGWFYLISQSYGVAFLIIVILALLVGSSIVSEEYKEGTVKLLKTLPTKRSNIILAKFATLVLTVSTLVIGIQIIFFIVLNIISDSFKYYNVYHNWISRYKLVGFKIYPILDNIQLLNLLECSLLQLFVEIIFIIAVSGAIIFLSTIFENGAFTSISFITVIIVISYLRQKILIVKTPVLKFLTLIFPWNFSQVYSNSMPGDIEWIFANSYVVIGLNLLLAALFVLGSIALFKLKEKV